ncbi:isoprenylcysteine carboxylmethyltransferase family protein [bacterium]|nr:isoprenylcysteine carboxylmethyltransferase family protein [bacterium]
MNDRPAVTDNTVASPADQRRLRPSEIFATLKSPLIYRNFLVHIFVMIPSTIFLAYLASLLDGTFGWSRIATLGARLGPAIVMFAAGAMIVVYCYAYLLLIGDGSPGSHLGGPKHLVASGPYALVRHPSVIGKLLGVVALGILVGSPSFMFIFIPILLTYSLITNRFIQEVNCERAFGPAYRDYRQRVPMIVPRLSDLRAAMTGRFLVVDIPDVETTDTSIRRVELFVYLILLAGLLAGFFLLVKIVSS